LVLENSDCEGLGSLKHFSINVFGQDEKKTIRFGIVYKAFTALIIVNHRKRMKLTLPNEGINIFIVSSFPVLLQCK